MWVEKFQWHSRILHFASIKLKCFSWLCRSNVNKNYRIFSELKAYPQAKRIVSIFFGEFLLVVFLEIVSFADEKNEKNCFEYFNLQLISGRSLALACFFHSCHVKTQLQTIKINFISAHYAIKFSLNCETNKIEYDLVLLLS